MSLSYLKEQQGHCQFEELNKIFLERSKWIKRDSAELFRRAIKKAPQLSTDTFEFNKDEVSIGKQEDLSPEEKQKLLESCKDLIPWRKGPFNLFGIEIDAEWRSDHKWQRLQEFLPDLRDKVILDVGCNNGYFMFRMAAQNPKLVLGIDPVLQNLAQFQLLQKYAQHPALHFELFGVEHLPYFENYFDVIFSMGIIYHHRNPMQQLLDIRQALTPGGQVILETIGIPGEESYCLYPEDRYAKMRNVWFVPTLSCFINWVKRAKFKDVKLISDSDMTSEEQRLTEFCPPPRQSLDDFLDPNDKTKTIEGYPAPRRFCLIATKPKQ